MAPNWMRRIVGGGAAEPAAPVAPVSAGEITKVFAAPTWLRDVGLTSWLLVGLLIVLVGMVWLLSLIAEIAVPVVSAGIIAAVAAPIITWLNGRGMPRGVAAMLLMLAVVLVIAGTAVIVVGGIIAQADAIKENLDDAAARITDWLKDLGINGADAEQTRKDAETSVSDAFSTLMGGISSGLKGLSSAVVFLSFMVLSLFFLLKDGPTIRAWIERQAGIDDAVAHSIGDRILQSLRGYFLGVTAIAVFNGIVVAIGAIALGVPLVGTIVLVTFIGAYIPFVGAWAAGAFSVFIALGAAGEEAAVGMAIIQLLANGVLQQFVQPIAYGAALGIHPLAVLIVTIAGGCLFGTIGLILAAPVTSAIVRIVSDMAVARESAGDSAGNSTGESALGGGTAPQGVPT